ncbi:hypothetical protein AYI70_g10477 [Smittium culicis]|uniref:Uncharacterized protein n=1 Tax=Smittium culicis TaxID=133412 RepID=A0A1R1X6G0_9FUNG|nr:hypothetical protein AYI70_g10477 [Smittium culicis]
MIYKSHFEPFRYSTAIPVDVCKPASRCLEPGQPVSYCGFLPSSSEGYLFNYRLSVEKWGAAWFMQLWNLCFDSNRALNAFGFEASTFCVNFE